MASLPSSGNNTSYISMKKKLLVLLMLLVGYSSFAQINYESGYYVDNNGQKHEVLIRNADWRENPDSFEFKTSKDGKSQTADIDTVREFGVDAFSVYRRFTVDIDQSSENRNDLSRQRAAEMVEETVFLKLLLEGKANLYQYVGEANRFFYSVNDGPVSQLIFKKFQSGNTVRTNNRFRQQLLNDLKCEGLDEGDVTRLNYKKDQLEKFFKKYNTCMGSESISSRKSSSKGKIHLSVKAGANYSTLEIYKDANLYQGGRNVNFDRTLNPRFGIEGEYVMPFNKNKWAVFLEASYEQLNVEQEYYYVPQLPSYGTSSAKVGYKSIAVPIGLRHYFYLSSKSSIFLSGAYTYNFYFSTEGNSNKYFASDHVEFTDQSHSLEFSLGYNLNKKFSIEARYGTGRDIFSDYSLWKTGKSNFYSIMIGYTIF